MLHSDPIMAPLRGWKLRKKKGFFAAEGKGRTIRREGKKLVQDGEQEHFWSHPYLRCDPFSRRSSLSFSFVFLSSCLAGEWLENRLFFNMPKKCCATQRQQTAGVVVGHWRRKRWWCWEVGAPTRTMKVPQSSLPHSIRDPTGCSLHYIITATWYMYASDKGMENPPRRSFSAAELGV